jgi:hypothetical protein
MHLGDRRGRRNSDDPKLGHELTIIGTRIARRRNGIADNQLHAVLQSVLDT